MADLKLDAKLDLDTQQAQGRLSTFSKSLGLLNSKLEGYRKISSGYFGSMVGYGALSSGIGLAVTGFRGLVGFATDFNQTVDKTRIGLASVMSAVDHLSFGSAQTKASGVFEQLTNDAIKSTATTEELFGIYQSIYGPIRAAGEGMATVREVTNNTVAAASALNVDFAQASRDISAMVRGSAGLDVKLFSMLRSTGAIAENAQAFNKLSQVERITKLRTALGQFTAASEAYGHSYAGVMSTFKDIMQQASGKLFQPVFAKVTAVFDSINGFLIRNKDEIMTTLIEVGERMGRVFDKIRDAGRFAYEYLARNWDTITARVHDTISKFRAMLPLLITAAKVWGAVQLGQGVLGAGAGIVGGGARMAAAFLPASAAGGGGAAALSGVFAALAPAAGYLAIALAAVGSAIYVVYDHWQSFIDIFAGFSPFIDAIGADLKSIVADLWDIFRPFAKILGGATVGVVLTLLMALAAVLRLVASALTYVTRGLAYLSSTIEPQIDYAINKMLEFFKMVAAYVGDLFGQHTLSRTLPPGSRREAFQTLDYIRDRKFERMGDWRSRAEGSTTERSTVVNDFRGSKITVHQEFREADPDRVALQMIESLVKEADQRTQSGFVPALTR